MHLILWARKAAVFSAKIEVSVILKMKLSVNEAKLTHLWTRNYVIDFKICLRPLVISSLLLMSLREYTSRPTIFQKSSLDVGGRSVKDD